MYSKIKEKLKERMYNSKELKIESILNKGIYHLLYSTNKESNDIEITIKKMIDDLKRIL